MSSKDYVLTIREQHLDTFGHVNNATYLTLYEEARWERITAGGFGLDKIRTLGQGPVILDVHLKFLKELRLREEIRITIEMVNYHGKLGKMKQQMLKSDGSLASEALFTFGLFDLKTRRLIPPSQEWLDAIN